MITLGATTRPWHKWTLEQACKSISDSGYKEVSIYSNAGKIPVCSESSLEEVSETIKIVNKYNLTPVMLLGSPKLELSVDQAIDDFNKLIDVSSKLRVKWLMNGGTEDPKLYDKYIEIMRKCSEHAWNKGIQILLKPHGGIGLTGQMLADVVEKVDNPAFRICYDPGNIIYYTKGDVRPETDVDEVAQYVAFCIIKDCIITEDGTPDVWIMPGEGLVDFPTVLRKLIDAGFSGPLHVECLGGSELDDINSRARNTKRWLEDLINELL